MRVFAYLYFEHPLGAPSDVGSHLTLLYSPAATGPVGVFIRAAGLAMLACPRQVRQTGRMEAFGEGQVPVAIIDDSDSQLTRARLALLDHCKSHGATAPSTYEAFRPHISLDPAAVVGAELPKAELQAVGFGLRLTSDDDELLVDHRWPFDASPMAECPGPDMSVARPASPGQVVGRPMRVARVGHVYGREGSGPRGRALTHQDLVDAVEYFQTTGDEIPIDREHVESCPGGRVLALYLVDDGQAIAVLPAYNATRPDTCLRCAAGACPNPLHEPLADFISRQNGVCWPSPRIKWGPATDAATGDVIGQCRIPNLAITTKPATAHRAVDEARLAEETPMELLLEALKADPRTPTSLLEAAEALREQFVDDPQSGASAVVKLLLDSLEAVTASVAAEQQPAEDARAEGTEPDEGRGSEGGEGEGGQGEGSRGGQADEGDEDRRSESDAARQELLAVIEQARSQHAALDARVEEARAEQQQVTEARFSAGVESGRWSEAERELFMHLSGQVDDNLGRAAFEKTFMARQPGHVQTDVRLSEGAGHRPAGGVFDRIDADRQDGETFNEALARWEAAGKV